MVYKIGCASILLLSLVSGCKESATAPTEQVFPEKRYPYTVSFEPGVYRQRREDLVQSLPEGSLVIATTASLFLRNGDVNYEFRPASTFFYLTGFDEPNAVAVIHKRTGGGSLLVLFVEERSGTAAQWLGPVYGTEGAITRFRADSAYGITSLAGALGVYLGSGTVQTVVANLDVNEEVRQIYLNLPSRPAAMMGLDSLVDRLRPVKSSSELGLLRSAVDVSVQAFQQGIKNTRPLMYEYEVEAVFDYILGANGCPWTAFPTIVASGPNSETIHYTRNSRQMQDGELVMIDFGAEYGYYAADLTRTIPVNGKFSPGQAVIYDIVKSARDLVIASAKPGVAFSTLSSMNVDKLIDGLLQQGVITGTRSVIVNTGQYRQYIPAGLGHLVGLDVHDPWPNDGAGRLLRENMVLAVEPHLYLGSSDVTVAPAYRGICVRIEDDLLITSAGNEVLSSSLAASRAEIENLMKR
jgi:Xaa-Pro aminopeptidase